MKSDINVTPLIDVLLVLLIIFILVAPLAPTALDASLPQPPEREADRTRGGLVLEVRAADYALNTTPVLDDEALRAQLQTALATRDDPTLFVRVAPGVGYDRVIEALDVARSAGAGRIGLGDEVAQRSLPDAETAEALPAASP